MTASVSLRCFVLPFVSLCLAVLSGLPAAALRQSSVLTTQDNPETVRLGSCENVYCESRCCQFGECVDRHRCWSFPGGPLSLALVYIAAGICATLLLGGFVWFAMAQPMSAEKRQRLREAASLKHDDQVIRQAQMALQRDRGGGAPYAAI
mmetsp:Transcript_55187/g.107956  ORF Transcript_55187/g.107956 Transcript_55187/m.107956 type:complete len:150 (+) Transcript_55187:166-615(+)